MTNQYVAEPELKGGESGGESTTTVIIAFFANLGIAVSKTVVALITGSASMLAESAHSWADTGNQVLLWIADRRSRREPDSAHPFGYGREAYVWAMLAALGLFTAGAVVSVWNGVSKLTESSEETSYTWAYVVLAIAFVFEGVSFLQAFRQTRGEARALDRDVLEHALATSDPTLRAVFAEDSAALIGLVIAALGIFLHQVTGNAVYDAIGSIIVGLLLGVVAIVLINRNRRFLTGQETDDRLRGAAVDRLKEMSEISRVTYLRLEFVGPRQVLLVANVDLVGELPETKVAYMLRDLEERLERDPQIADAVLTLATPDEPSI
ncbi:MAG TPA: cation transporter [Nocardioidaceae bacterium]|nr:cation transporter [Nocardioidaceae bacterium]